MENFINNVQEQATAAWIDYLNQNRLDRLVQELNQQDINLEAALSELEKVKEFISNPEHILGSPGTKHGEIAEHMQVNFSNARKLIDGYLANHDIDSVGRTAPEDYLRDGLPVQSKFLNGIRSTLENGVRQHLEKYPDFVKNGGSYDIPKDQYDEIQRLLELRRTAPTQLSKSDLKILKVIDELEKETGLRFGKDIHSSVVDYQQVQTGKANQTIDEEDKSIRKKDEQNRDEAYERSKPTVQEGLKTTAVSAISEGGVAFCLAVARKRKEGKHLSDFTAQDWADVGIDTGKNTIKGGIRGASVYTLSNFTATPACVASALVSAIFGVVSQAQALRRGKITQEDFLINSEAVCLDVTVSAISSTLGQVLIPIPILGAVIGNVTGMFLYGIAKQCNLDKEKNLISKYQNELKLLDEKLNEQYRRIMQILDDNLRKFKSMMDFAFDPNVNKAFQGSIEFARFNGVPENKIIKNKSELDAFFLN